jgi:hypothetical protein
VTVCSLDGEDEAFALKKDTWGVAVWGGGWVMGDHQDEGRQVHGTLTKQLDHCSLGLSATSQQYFSLRTNQPPTTSQQYFSLRTNQHQPSATSQTSRLLAGSK